MNVIYLLGKGFSDMAKPKTKQMLNMILQLATNGDFNIGIKIKDNIQTYATIYN